MCKTPCFILLAIVSVSCARAVDPDMTEALALALTPHITYLKPHDTSEPTSGAVRTLRQVGQKYCLIGQLAPVPRVNGCLLRMVGIGKETEPAGKLRR